MQCDLIARGLSEQGHQVIYGAVGRKRKGPYSGLPYRVVSLMIEKRGELSRLLQQERPDVIYWRFNKHHLLQAVLESIKEKIPFVFAVSHVNDVTKYAYKYPLMTPGLVSKARSFLQIAISQVTSGWNYRAFRYVTAMTFQLNSQLLRDHPVTKKRVIWNSVSDKKEPFEWERPYCIWVANIKPSKQPEAYIKMASKMTEKCPGIDFLMIGAIQSEYYRPILKKAEQIPNFHYLGFQPLEVVNGALGTAECLIHTCKPEGFPNNMIQAWLQGCPTITLEYDPDGLIQRERLGFLSGSVEQMSKDVELLLRDKNLRDEIGSRAQAFARVNFTPERMIEEVESFLAEVVDEYKG